MTRRTKEVPQGVIDMLQDGDFMLAVSRFESDEKAGELVEDIAEAVAQARERHELSVEETALAVRLARVAVAGSSIDESEA